MVSLVGPNGSGKSTLLKSLVGIIHVSAGTVTIGGKQVTNMAPEEIARASAWVTSRRWTTCSAR